MKNKRRLSFRKEGGGWKGVSNPLLSLPFNGPISAGRKYIGRALRRDTEVLPSQLLSRFVLFDPSRKGKEGRRLRGSPIITPLNAFLLAHPSQMGAAVNIRKTTVLGGVSFDVLHGIAKKSGLFEGCSSYGGFLQLLPLANTPKVYRLRWNDGGL